jgi:cytochrome c oxidase subunit 3
LTPTATATTRPGDDRRRPASAGGAERHAARGDIDALLGMTIVIAAWVMLFAALFFAYGVIRVQAPEWPPFGAPRLPRVAPAISTLLLLAAGLNLRSGLRRARSARAPQVLRSLLATLVLGGGFLGGQLATWRTMNGRGLFPSSGVYGSVFFAFTGFHALHVLGGLIVVFVLAIQALRRPPRDVAMAARALRLAALYWDFVAVVWVLMYVSVYLV